MIRSRNTKRALLQERRAHKRYPLELDLRFIVRPRALPEINGQGRSSDISSAGLALHSTTKMTLGDHVFVTVAWPVPSGRGLPLQLVLSGRVVWSRGFTAGVSFSWHQFVSGTPLTDRVSLDCPVELPNPRPSARAPLILVVETPDVYLLITAMLARCRDVIRHVSVEVALEMLLMRDHPVDLLVTNTIREFAHFACTVPVIYTTFKGRSELEEVGLAGSPSVVELEKPIRFCELRAAVHRLLSQPVPLAGALPRALTKNY